MPEGLETRTRVQMPDGNVYSFPKDVTEDELIAFATRLESGADMTTFPVEKPPPHVGFVGRQVLREAGAAPGMPGPRFAMDTSPSTDEAPPVEAPEPPPLIPSHQPAMAGAVPSHGPSRFPLNMEPAFTPSVPTARTDNFGTIGPNPDAGIIGQGQRFLADLASEVAHRSVGLTQELATVASAALYQGGASAQPGFLGATRTPVTRDMMSPEDFQAWLAGQDQVAQMMHQGIIDLGGTTGISVDEELKRTNPMLYALKGGEKLAAGAAPYMALGSIGGAAGVPANIGRDALAFGLLSGAQPVIREGDFKEGAKAGVETAAGVVLLGLAFRGAGEIFKHLRDKVGLPPATARELARRAKALRVKAHPDLASDAPEAEMRTEFMMRVNQAVEAGDMNAFLELERAWNAREEVASKMEGYRYLEHPKQLEPEETGKSLPSGMFEQHEIPPTEGPTAPPPRPGPKPAPEGGGEPGAITEPSEPVYMSRDVDKLAAKMREIGERDGIDPETVNAYITAIEEGNHPYDIHDEPRFQAIRGEITDYGPLLESAVYHRALYDRMRQKEEEAMFPPEGEEKPPEQEGQAGIEPEGAVPAEPGEPGEVAPTTPSPEEGKDLEAYDRAVRDLERTGAAEIFGEDGDRISYKLIAETEEGPWKFERIIKGNRETILGNRDGQFTSLEAARLSANADMRRRVGPPRAAEPAAPVPEGRNLRDIPEIDWTNEELDAEIARVREELETAKAEGRSDEPALTKRLMDLVSEKASSRRREAPVEKPKPVPKKRERHVAHTEADKHEVEVISYEEFERRRKSYSADKFMEGKVRQPFRMNGDYYVAGGGESIGKEGRQSIWKLVKAENFEGETRSYGELPGPHDEAPLGHYHGLKIKRGKSDWVVSGPPIYYETPGWKAARAEYDKKYLGEEPAEPEIDAKTFLLDTMKADLEKGWTFQELDKAFFDEHGRTMEAGEGREALQELMDEGAIESTEVVSGGAVFTEFKAVGEEPKKPAKKKAPPKPKEEPEAPPKEMTPEEQFAAVTDEEFANDVWLRARSLSNTYQEQGRGPLVENVAKAWRGVPADIVRARAEETIDRLLEAGRLKVETTGKGKSKKEKILATGLSPKEAKHGQVVVKGKTSDAAYTGKTDNMRATGFSDAQHNWIAKTIEDVFDQLQDPMEDGPVQYALEMHVPDDGTFFIDTKATEEMYRTVTKTPSREKGKRLEGFRRGVETTSPISTSFGGQMRVKFKKPSMARKLLAYDNKAGWILSMNTEDPGVYTDGHVLILKEGLVEKPPKKAIGRLRKKYSEADFKYAKRPEAPVPKKATTDMVKKAKEQAKDTIVLRGYAWPWDRAKVGTIPWPYERDRAQWGTMLETAKGTRITDMGFDFDKWRFLEDVTGFDTVKTDLSKPYGERILSFYRDGKFVAAGMGYGTDFSKGEPNPAVEEATGEAPPGGAKASVGRYRAFSENNGPNGPKGQALAPPTVQQVRVLGLGMPELVELARILGKGKYPRIKRVLLRNPGVLGYFRPIKEPGKEHIRLKAGIFVEPDQAAAVLAHEIGHWIDFLPERTFARGNVLGRLMGVLKYLKKTASMDPDLPGHITPEDRERLRKEAKTLTREEYWEEVEEVIRKEFGITVDDILNIWRQYTPDAPADLIEYIKGLSSEQKVSIVKQAMQGLIAEELNRFKRVVEEKTGKVRRVKKVRYTDLETKYRELLFEEMRKRKIVTVEEIRDEMWGLSVEWRPLPEIVPASFLRYRKKGEEMYADVVSALFNDPDFLQRKAPKVYEMLLNYMQRNKPIWTDYMVLQKLMSDPAALREYRLDNYIDMIRRGEKSRAEKLQKMRERPSLARAIVRGLIDRNADWYRLQKKSRKADPEAKSPVAEIEEMMYQNSWRAWYLDVWTAEVKGVIGDLFNDVEFGALLGLRRAGALRTRGGRSTLANPLGIGGKDARELVSELLKRKKITRDQVRTVVKALKSWHELRMRVMDEIEASGMFPRDLIRLMRKSVGAYATYKVRQYIEDPSPAVAEATAYIHRQIGTFAEIGNPGVETILKDMALGVAAHRTMTIKSMIATLEEFEPEAIMPADEKRVRGVAVGFRPPPDGYKLVTILQSGKPRGWYMKEPYAATLTREETGTAYQFYRAATGLVRGVFVTHNPFWAIWNLQRDARAMTVNVVKGNAIISPLLTTYYLGKAVPDAFKDVWRDRLPMQAASSLYKAITGKEIDPHSEAVTQMLHDRALIQTGMRFWKAMDISQDEALSLLYERMGLTDREHRTYVRKVFGTLAAILSDPGQYSERLVKIAGYKYLKAHQDEFHLTDRQIAQLVRSRVGTPDIMRRGNWHSFTNSLFLFSNVAKEGYRAGWESFQDNWFNYVSKLLTYDILPTVVKWLAATGAFGLGVKSVMDRIPEYHKSMYTVVPVGLTSSGKAVYIILPHDHVGQLVAASTWEALKHDKELGINAMRILGANLPWSLGNIHPYIDTAREWYLYGTGINPQDWYRGRPIVPESVWESEDSGRKRGYMVKETLENVGGNILSDLSGIEDERGDVDPQSVADWIQKMSGWPVAGSFVKRFVRVSDRGLLELGYDELNALRQPSKNASAKRDEAIDEILKVDPKADWVLVALELNRRGVDWNYKGSDKERERKIKARIQQRRRIVHGDVFDRLDASARNADERDVIEDLRDYYGTKPPKEE